jgi:hypothetical protein
LLYHPHIVIGIFVALPYCCPTVLLGDSAAAAAVAAVVTANDDVGTWGRHQEQIHHCLLLPMQLMLILQCDMVLPGGDDGLVV